MCGRAAPESCSVPGPRAASARSPLTPARARAPPRGIGKENDT